MRFNTILQRKLGEQKIDIITYQQGDNLSDIEEPQYPNLVIENNDNLEDVSAIAELIVAH